MPLPNTMIAWGGAATVPWDVCIVRASTNQNMATLKAHANNRHQPAYHAMRLLGCNPSHLCTACQRQASAANATPKTPGTVTPVEK